MKIQNSKVAEAFENRDLDAINKITMRMRFAGYNYDQMYNAINTKHFQIDKGDFEDLMQEVDAAEYEDKIS